MVIVGGWVFLMTEVPLYIYKHFYSIEEKRVNLLRLSLFCIRPPPASFQSTNPKWMYIRGLSE